MRSGALPARGCSARPAAPAAARGLGRGAQSLQQPAGKQANPCSRRKQVAFRQRTVKPLPLSALRHGSPVAYRAEADTKQRRLGGSCFILTSSVDIFLTGVPDPSVEIPEKEAVISRLPAVMNHILVRLICSLIPAVVEAVCLLLFPTARLGDPLCALTPVGRDKSCCREEESHQIQTHC